MGYQIIAEVELEDANDPRQRLLHENTRIRRAGFDSDECIASFDIRSSFDTQRQDALWLCEQVLKAGILNFSIRHSY